MIFLRAFCIFAIALPCLSAPDLSQAVARISEARARAAANRQRIKEHSARISSHVRTPISRSKRQYAPEYETPLSPPPPPPGYKLQEFEEPEFIHICSVEDSYEDRSAENLEDAERSSHFEEENSLDLQNFDRQRPNSKALDHGWDSLNSTRLYDGEKQDRYSQFEDEEKLRDAEPHLHSHFRQHIRGHLPILPSHGVSPSLHLPTSHVAPGLHLNINQNAHGLHHQLHGLNHQILPTSSVVNQGVFPTQSVISTQTQPLLHRSSSGFGLTPQTRPPTQIFHSTFSPGGNILTPRPINQGAGSWRGSFFPGSRLGAEFKGNQPDDITELGEENSREANPTLKKLKRKKLQYYSQYPPVYSKHGPYRENDSEEEDDDEEEERVASPTHKLIKKKKMMKMQPYYPSYPMYPQYYQANYGYRDADEDEDEEVMERKASPTIKKLKRKKMQKFYPYSPQPHYGRYRSTEASGEDFSTEEEERQFRSLGKLTDAEDFFVKDKETVKEMERKNQQKHDDNEDFSSAELREIEDPTLSPGRGFLLNFPQRRRFNDQYKRSLSQRLDTILGEQRKLVQDLEKQSKDDENLKLIADIGNRSLAAVEEKRKISKRSLPLTRLIVDPNAKLDVPKTIENFGTATRSAFEDERAPMYHFKHLMGSSRNALLSAMRIPPQNMIIPTDYEIVKTSEVRRSEPEEDPDDSFSQTFRKVGEMVRDGIKSGQETAFHLGEAAHSARNVLHSARHSAPRLIIPYSQIPAFQKTHKPKKAVLITPRILDVAHEQVLGHSSDSKPHFVKLGHLMDAVGISNPEAKSLDLQKIVFEPRLLSAAKVDERLLQLHKMRSHDSVDEALNTLENAKLSVGAKNLRDFLVKMKHELTNFIKHIPGETKSLKKKKKKHHDTKEIGKFIENLFDKTKVDEETVGDGLHLPPELLHPFMGRATTKDLKTFLRENGDEDFDEKHFKQIKDLKGNNSNLGYVLGAINPLMFERMYNETVEVKKEDPEEMGRNDTVGTVMTLTQPMLRPFMGQARPQQVEDLLDTYNEDEEESFEDDNKMK